MSKSRPEHIDDIENFYRDQLKDLDIEPPAEIWNNISGRIAKPSKPFYKTSGFFVGVTATLFTIVTLFLLQWEQEDNKVIDDFKEKHHLTPKKDTQIVPLDEPTKSTEQKKPTQSLPSKRIESNSKQDAKKASAIVAKDTLKSGEEIPTLDNTTETKVTDPQPIETKTEPPVKKKSFFEKQKENYSDSTRKLFVPKK